MTPFYVADVGNSRIKVGRCGAAAVEWSAALAPADFDAVEVLAAGTRWAVAGVQPAWRDQFADRLRARGQVVRVLTDYRELPIRVDVEAPERVGIDRLLNAVGVRPRAGGVACAVASVGTAVTVDLIDAAGTFRGGAIFPGFRLMAQALHAHTAQLPLVDDFSASPLPGRDTRCAIAGGIAAAVAGGIDRAVATFAEIVGPLRVFLTGGDAELVGPLRSLAEPVGPFLALEGLRRTVVGQP